VAVYYDPEYEREHRSARQGLPLFSRQWEKADNPSLTAVRSRTADPSLEKTLNSDNVKI